MFLALANFPSNDSQLPHDAAKNPFGATAARQYSASTSDRYRRLGGPVGK
jgi:hypothetical protein